MKILLTTFTAALFFLAPWNADAQHSDAQANTEYAADSMTVSISENTLFLHGRARVEGSVNMIGDDITLEMQKTLIRFKGASEIVCDTMVLIERPFTGDHKDYEGEFVPGSGTVTLYVDNLQAPQIPAGPY